MHEETLVFGRKRGGFITYRRGGSSRGGTRGAIYTKEMDTTVCVCDTNMTVEAQIGLLERERLV